jgi:diadenosine tetraphosphate (Ap4A) HIT family hydrolase
MQPFESASFAPTGCPYCDRVFNRSQTGFAPWDHILFDFQGNVVVPSRGSLVEGWLLVIPRDHTLSSVQLDVGRRVDLHDCVTLSRSALRDAYGPDVSIATFEHGAAVSRSIVGCGIDHVHLHVVPLSFDLADAARRHPLGTSLTWASLRDWDAFYAQPVSTGPYVAVRVGDGSLWVGTGPIVSQFFRRVIADTVGKTDRYDWKADDGLANVEGTIERVRLQDVHSVV